METPVYVNAADDTGRGGESLGLEDYLSGNFSPSMPDMVCCWAAEERGLKTSECGVHTS